MKKTLKKVLLGLLLSACAAQPEGVLVDQYGAKAPVLCLKNTPKYNAMYACRDSNNSFWICDDDEHCMAAIYPSEVFAVPMPKTAEAVNGP